jgi:serine/alanine adding enzyme
MNVSIASKQDRDTWDTFVVSSPTGTAYHLMGWKDIIERSYGHESYYLVAKENDTIIGILPLVLIRSRVFGNSLTSLPFVNYGGFCTLSSIAQQSLLEKAIVLVKQNHAKYIEFRHLQDLPGISLPSRLEKVTLLLDLPSSAEKLWKQFDPKLRNQIRKAIRSGLTFKLGGKELLPYFYQVFSNNMRDLGSPVHSQAFFEHILLTFPELTRVACVFSDQQHIIGAAILIRFKDQIEVPWASSLRKYIYSCPNNLLYWEILKYACEQNIHYFDFGRSTRNSGTFKFKTQWGAKPKQLYWYYYLDRTQQIPQTLAQSATLQMMSQIWKRMPVRLTQKLGPFIRKNLPV